MRPIRVLHVVDSLGNGGLEAGVVSLINHHDAERFENSVCAVSGLGVNAGKIAADRVPILQIRKGERSRVQFTALRRIIREVKPDIVHSNNWGGIEAIPAARVERGCAAVHTEHGFDASPGAPEPWRRACFRRLAFELANRVVCVSRQVRDCHAKRSRFAACRMAVIHNGVDCRRFCPNANTRARVRRELGIAEDVFCVGCVGNLLPVKDHMTLLAALARLRETAQNWRLLVAGEGPERPTLEAAARTLLGRGPQVTLLGASDRIPELLAAFDVYVLPSLSEGISYSLLEAMATSLPVIASRVGGNPEVVEDGVSGLLFPAGDATELANHLFRAHAERPRFEELGKSGRRRVEESFSVEAMVAGYERLYRSVLGPSAMGTEVEHSHLPEFQRKREAAPGGRMAVTNSRELSARGGSERVPR